MELNNKVLDERISQHEKQKQPRHINFINLCDHVIRVESNSTGEIVEYYPTNRVVRIPSIKHNIERVANGIDVLYVEDINN